MYGDLNGLEAHETVHRVGYFPNPPLAQGAGEAEALGVVVGAVKVNVKGYVGGVKAQILGGVAVLFGMGNAVHPLLNGDVIAAPLSLEVLPGGGNEGY
jgi:hypothetical protein